MKVKAHKAEQDIIIEGLRKHGKNAYTATLANGIAVTVLRGRNICRIEPNGEVFIVERINKSKVKVAHKSFKLK